MGISNHLSIFKLLAFTSEKTTDPDFKGKNKSIKNSINNPNSFVEACLILYVEMEKYSNSRNKDSSKFPIWFEKIKKYKPNDYFSSLIFLNAIVENGIPSRFSKWNSDRKNEINKICEQIRKNNNSSKNSTTSDSLDKFLDKLNEILDSAIENPEDSKTENSESNASGHDWEIKKPNEEIKNLISSYDNSNCDDPIIKSVFDLLFKILNDLTSESSVSINELQKFDSSLELANLDKNDVFGQIKENIIEIYELSSNRGKEKIKEATFDDFNSDSIGIAGKYRRWSRCEKDWQILKKLVVNEISNIDDIDMMLKKLESAGWSKQEGDRYVGTEDFSEAATSIIGAYATFIQKAFKQVRSSGKKLKKLNMTNPKKFKKSKKMKVISLLLNYVFTYVMGIKYDEINVIYAGTHGVFVEILNSAVPSVGNPSVDARYFKLSDLDQEIDISSFVRVYDVHSVQNDRENMEQQIDLENLPDNEKNKLKQKKLSNIKNLSLYKKVSKMGKNVEKSKAGILEVENQKAINIHSVRHLIKIEKDVCECLKDLHNNCLVHGDLKEDNIVITKHGARVIDVDGIQFEGLHHGTGSLGNRPTSNIAGNFNPFHLGKVYDNQFKDLYSFGAMIKRQIKSLLRKNKSIDQNDNRLQNLREIANLCMKPKNVKKEQTDQKIPRKSYTSEVIYKKLNEIK